MLANTANRNFDDGVGSPGGQVGQPVNITPHLCPSMRSPEKSWLMLPKGHFETLVLFTSSTSRRTERAEEGSVARRCWRSGEEREQVRLCGIQIMQSRKAARSAFGQVIPVESQSIGHRHTAQNPKKSPSLCNDQISKEDATPSSCPDR
jgi:hypothetical protein